MGDTDIARCPRCGVPLAGVTPFGYVHLDHDPLHCAELALVRAEALAEERRTTLEECCEAAGMVTSASYTEMVRAVRETRTERDALLAVVRLLPTCACGTTATRGGDGSYYCDAHGPDRCNLPWASTLRAPPRASVPVPGDRTPPTR